MIKAVIYDMDGTIIDSEPLWRRALIEVFADYDIAMTESMCKVTTGLRIDEVVEYWAHRHPHIEEKVGEIENRIMTTMMDFVKNEGKILDGVQKSMEYFAAKNLTLALASASKMDLINTVVDHFELRKYFEVIYSAEHEEYGKPHPGVYITTINKLGFKPQQCIAIEDSINGVLSAKSAKIKCVAVPEKVHRNDRRYGIADVTLDSLSDLDESVWSSLDI